MGRAITLEQLFLYERLRTERYGIQRPWFTVSLGWLSKWTKTARMSVSRYLKWLSERGFILIRKIKEGRYDRIQIRLLLRPVTVKSPDVTKTLRNSKTPVNSIAGDPSAPPDQVGNNSPAKAEEAPPAPPTVIMTKRPGLTGKVADAAERMKAKAVARKVKDTRPTPTEAAHEWNRLLREWGDHPFTLEPKTLAHVRKTLAHIGPADLPELRARLDKAIEWWSANNSQFPKMKGQPAHPWVINRHLVEAFATAPEPAPAPTPEPITPPTVAQPAQPAAHKGNSLLGMFQKKKKKYGAPIPSIRED